MRNFAIRALHVNLLLLDAGTQEAPGRAHEVTGVAGALEAQKVSAQQAVNNLPAPRELREDLRGREGNVVEEADLQVRPGLAEHSRNQLELVVLDPHSGAFGGMANDGVGKLLIDLAVGIPPRTVELRRCDHVVVKRPDGRVGEALVVQLHFVAAELDRDEVHAFVAEGTHRLVGRSMPTHPRAVGLCHHRRERRDQAPG
ncbi:hypothetical protein D3C73_1071660 [compost metagenome]